MNNKPQQYVQGFGEFYKLKFKVTSDTLIPRSETELLVELVLQFLQEHPGEHTVLDLGTGAGSIAIAIAKNHPDCKIIASEVSAEALEVAKLNAKYHHVEDRMEFVVSDLLSDINTTPDIIVTNLPYIPSERISYLDSSVKDYEPHIALDGGSDGFDLYRKLFSQISEKGWKPKLIVGEIDYTQGEISINEAYKYFSGSSIHVDKDLARHQRILIITS